MEPTLADGCAVLVELGRRRPRDGGIYVIRIGDELIVKRVVRAPEAGWLLVSDNPDKKHFRQERGPTVRRSPPR